jgi:hypothetical protein
MAKPERIRLLTPTFRVRVPDVFVKRVFQGQGEESGRYDQLSGRVLLAAAGEAGAFMLVRPSTTSKPENKAA